MEIISIVINFTTKWFSSNILATCFLQNPYLKNRSPGNSFKFILAILF